MGFGQISFLMDMRYYQIDWFILFYYNLIDWSICFHFQFASIISKRNLEALFYRGGRILDIFIHSNQSRRKNRVFAFVQFAARREVEHAIEPATGRSWGGKKD